MNDWVVLVVIGAGCIVLSRFLPKTSSPPAASMVRELEETMEHFASEIEEENKQLLDSVSRMKQTHEQQVGKLTDKIESLEKQSLELSSELKHLIYSKLQALENGNALTAAALAPVEAEAAKAAELAAEASKPNVSPEEEVGDETKQTESVGMRDRFAHIFNLYDEGKSIEHIAKKLGLTKGEVNLIVQLAKQEEESRG
ncbi:DUF6115 domain-containing protein [Paenibacillus sp. MBLB4367]|uniref:DUF6115 domain-containing protein n=1 Tax=Paenibacillus sp. MBLB4367 TaxID=3384767 RepID=UPI0039083569